MSIKVFFCLLMIAVLLNYSVAAFAKENAKPVERSKVLFTVGGPFHDQPELYPILNKILEDTGDFTVTLSRDLDQFKAENIKNYDLVVIYATHLKMNKEQEDGLINFIKDGKGLVGIHCATDTFMDSDPYWKLIGARFTKHDKGTFKVNITGKSHVTVNGMSSFDIFDESYRHNFNPESKLIVLMRRDMDSDPVTWVQNYGKGRVFNTSLGHGMEAWSNPAFQEMVKRGAEWATFRLNP